MKSISILLPTYNCHCVQLVEALHRQCEAVGGLCYEIIVADDGSSQTECVEHNKSIERLQHVQYLQRRTNVGRSRIRNFLVSQAQNEWVIFIDGDLALDNPSFIQNYLEAEGDVIVGGISISLSSRHSPLATRHSLRFRYERAAEEKHNAAHRRMKAYQEFRTTNFMARRSVMVDCPFDESITHYGYEDVLLGKLFRERGYRLTHIDNPILLDSFESNEEYLKKMETSCETLFELRDKLKGYSTLLGYAEKLRRWHLLGTASCFFAMTEKAMKRNLLGNNPSVFVFNIYKLGYYIHHAQNRKD